MQYYLTYFLVVILSLSPIVLLKFLGNKIYSQTKFLKWGKGNYTKIIAIILVTVFILRYLGYYNTHKYTLNDIEATFSGMH